MQRCISIIASDWFATASEKFPDSSLEGVLRHWLQQMVATHSYESKRRTAIMFQEGCGSSEGQTVG